MIVAPEVTVFPRPDEDSDRWYHGLTLYLAVMIAAVLFALFAL
jgi:hypothetical protein